MRQYVGFDKVSLTEEGTVKKQYPEIYLDFNAIAKGYGLDKIAAYLSSQGISNYLIELGGEVLAKGKNLHTQKDWIVAIEDINSPLLKRTSTVALRLQNRAMAASGNYRKYRVDRITGKKYVHTINPITGKAEQSTITSATVIAPNCALADAYATSCMALGFDKAVDLLEQLPEVDAYLTYIDKGGISQVYYTKGMEQWLLE